VLSNPPKEAATAPAPPATDLGGRWDVRIGFAASQSSHTLHLLQRGNDITGIHQGEFVSRDVIGTIDGNTVTLHSAYGEEHGDALHFTFTGTVSGDAISGTLDMGEYLGAKWNAARHVADRS
jgi:L-seryl-tRNA(Ser) seleniumtransferase